MRDGGIFALDLASVAGLSYGYPGEEPVCRSHRFSTPGVSLGRYVAEYVDWLIPNLVVYSPQAIAYEATILTQGNTSIDTARKLMGIAARTEEVAFRRGIKVVSYPSSTVSKWFCGYGGAGDRKKKAVYDACRTLGWTPQNFDESDALALWAYACHELAPKARERRYLGPLLGATAA